MSQPSGAALSPARGVLTPLVVGLCAAPFVVVLDANSVTVALAAIRAGVRVSPEALQWVVAGYSLSFGGALLLAGRAADLYGRRRLLIAGLVVFASGAAVAALAPNAAVLVGGRVAQGFGAALAFPAALALIAVVFEEGAARTRVLGVYGAAISTAFVGGVLVGGLLTSLAGWRAVVFLGCPLGLAAGMAAWRFVPPDQARHGPRSLDVTGALLLAAAVLALLIGLRLLSGGRVSPEAIAAIALCAALFAVAFRYEHGRPDAVVPASLLRRRNVQGAALAAFLTVGTGVGAMYMLSLRLQDTLGLEPMESALALVSLGVAGIPAGMLAAVLSGRLGAVPSLVAALLLQAGGAAFLASARGIGSIVVGLAVLGAGHFGATAAFTVLVGQGLASDEQGAAMGVVSAAQQVGGAVGLVLLVSLATAGGHGLALAGAAALSGGAALGVVAVTRR